MGGIFYDWHDSGDWDADLAFTQAVGRALLDIHPDLVRGAFSTAWSAEAAKSNCPARALCRVQPAV